MLKCLRKTNKDKNKDFTKPYENKKHDSVSPAKFTSN